MPVKYEHRLKKQKQKTSILCDTSNDAPSFHLGFYFWCDFLFIQYGGLTDSESATDTYRCLGARGQGQRTGCDTFHWPHELTTRCQGQLLCSYKKGRESKLLYSQPVVKLQEAPQIFMMVDYVRKMSVKKSCTYGEYGLFKHFALVL